MVKYATKDAIDFVLYHNREVILISNTVQSYSLSNNKLIIRDALIDIEFLTNVLQGRYEGEILQFMGSTNFRGIDGADKETKIIVEIVELDSYGYSSGVEQVSVPTLVLRFPTENFEGNPNVLITMDGKK